jgi:hypothetical protein
MALKERTRVIAGPRRAPRRGEPCGSSSKLVPIVVCLGSSPQLQLAASLVPVTAVSHSCPAHMSITDACRSCPSRPFLTAICPSCFPRPPVTPQPSATAARHRRLPHSLTHSPATAVPRPPSLTAAHQRPCYSCLTPQPAAATHGVCHGDPRLCPSAVAHGCLPRSVVAAAGRH